MTKFCLTGTTGNLGSRVLHHLLFTLHVPPEDITISLYNPSNALNEAQRLGVTILKGNYLDTASLKESFQGTDRLLLVSYPSIAHKIRVEAHINAINAARDVGIKHIYYTSLAFGDESKAAVKQAHIDTEAYLGKVASESNLTYTIIKEGIYSESFPLYLNFHELDASSSARTAILPMNPSRGIAWATQDDLGEATARIMIDDAAGDKWRNQRVLLSGPEAWTLDQVATCISEIKKWKESGHPLEIKAIGEEAWIDHQTEVKSGKKDDPQTREFMAQWASTFPAIEKGELAVVDPLCEQLLGRECVRMDAYLRGFLAGQVDGGDSIERYAR